MVADIAKALSAKRPARDSLPWEEMQAIISADAALTRGWGSFGARLRASKRRCSAWTIYGRNCTAGLSEANPFAEYAAHDPFHPNKWHAR